MFLDYKYEKKNGEWEACGLMKDRKYGCVYDFKKKTEV